MHSAKAKPFKGIMIEVLWADEWPDLSGEAEIQLAGQLFETPQA